MDFSRFFKHIPATYLLLFAMLVPAEDSNNISISKNFSIVLPDEAGHHAPIVEYFRRLERIIRQVGKFDHNAAGDHLQLVMSNNQSTGSFIKLRKNQAKVLLLPVDYRKYAENPQLGRTLVTALIQTRLGNSADTPLPPEAVWIADGLWAEFIQREKTGKVILRFTYLPGLRNLAVMGFEIKLNNRLLMPPENIRYKSAEWILYTQRCQLMLETAGKLNIKRNDNVLKDYCFLLFGKKMSADECFINTFGIAARRKAIAAGVPAEFFPDDEKIAGEQAVSRFAMHELFSGHVPMPANALLKRLDAADRVEYMHSTGKFQLTAALSDLPHLVEKYEFCAIIPRLKTCEINELAAFAPFQLRPYFLNLANQLTTIGHTAPDKASRQIKLALQELRQQLIKLQKTESFLENFENSQLPLLYEQRFVLNGTQKKAVMPLTIDSFIDSVERLNNR